MRFNYQNNIVLNMTDKYVTRITSLKSFDIGSYSIFISN